MIIILHNIRSLYNVGSIFRTADACGAVDPVRSLNKLKLSAKDKYGWTSNGVDKIFLCGITPKPIDEFGQFRQQLTKVSLGAEKYIPWEHCASVTRLIDKLKKQGYKIFAIEQSKKSIPYYNIRRGEGSQIVLILGNEVKGLTRSILNRADKILEIPMRGKKESLNVAVAFGIVAFHIISPN